jgi:hypothetical protein
MKSKRTRLVLLIALLILVAIQFVPVNREAPESDPNQRFLAIVDLDEAHGSVLKNACFDCHSNRSRYPWYAYIAPASFVIQNHINEGRSELNFDEWNTYSLEKKKHKLEEVSESLRENWMPLTGYEKLHQEAQLTAEQREDLAKAIDAIRARL